jgi:glycosyltransferase A (GT-A) superfamily protein (DUF2064 family)
VTPPGADLTPFIGPDQEQIAQEGADLGERMHRCFGSLIGGGARRVVMIGADVPHIADAAVSEAFAALDHHDAALVPTRDGGYALIGLSAMHDLFSGVPMGTATVFAQTEKRLSSLGLRSQVLGSTFDVDELDDVIDLMRLIAAGGAKLPHTAAVIREWQRRGVVP